MKRFSQLTQTASEADLVAGKFLAIDDPNGMTKKLPGNCVAPKSIQDNLIESIAPVFDEDHGGPDGDGNYPAGYSVMYQGRRYTFKVDHSGAWNAADVDDADCSESYKGAKQIKIDNNGEFALVIADKDGNVLGYVGADGFFRHFTKDVFDFIDINSIGNLGENAKKVLALACNIEISEGDFVRIVSDKNGFVLETISPDGIRKYYTKDVFSFLDLAPDGMFGDTIKAKILELVAECRTIIVDKNGGGDFTTITAAIRSIAGDSTHKTIKIMAGVYDMYNEIGGDAFIASLPPEIQISDWSTYCDIIPTNTKIIGVGNVTIDFKMPDTVSSTVSLVFSPLNCRGSVDFENLVINAENCRYGIHDESSGGAEYIGAVKHYKNVTINRTGDSSLGASCLGVGFSKNTTFVFDNCTFKHENAKSPVYMHTWATTEDYSSIIFNNCIFISPSGTNNAIFESTTINSSSKITASLNNCYCAVNQVRLVASSKTCYIQLNAMKSGITTHTSDYSSLAYTPNYYN